ncbi:uncharacterized protein Pyn_38546 [Prunus yedoensis var. nudiflora]|uniref:Uncharacterized protein n=1 Tax=Prunus yedoensis var. nudiflora TaxID=2094558 RepID=A0A314UN44_PRUYE|nr:uncharacterized protein Pyn_38546 [Prunus yedoensis var. nudiflora]
MGEAHNGVGSFAAGHTNDIFELPVITMWDLTGEKHNGTGVVAQVESTKTQIVNDNASEEVMKETKTVDSAMDYSTKELQVAVTGISATASAHDQPLSLCIDEMHSVKP